MSQPKCKSRKLKRRVESRVHSRGNERLRRQLILESLEGRVLLAGLADKYGDVTPLTGGSNAVETGTVVLVQSGTINSSTATGPVYEGTPPLTEERQKLIDADQGALPDPSFYWQNSTVPSNTTGQSDATTTASPEVPAELTTAEDPNPQAPGTFTYFRSSNLSPANGFSSNTSEPSVASLDQAIFETHNWNAARSLDNGLNWTNVDPYTTFPSIFGGFCCDQRVAHDDSRDMLLWYLQYVKSGSTASDTGGVNIARVNNTTELANNSWVYYTFSPANFGYGVGEWLDFPDMEVTNDFAYFSSNLFTTTTNAYAGSVLWRVPLNELEAGGTVNYTYITTTDGTIGLTTNATNTMYAATVTNANSLKIYTWPDAGTLSTTTVGGLGTTYFGTHTSLDNDGNNWTGRADSRVSTGWFNSATNEIGFMWNSAESAANGRPLPFVRTAILNASTKAIVSQPDVWSTTTTWHYPAISTNSSGDLGGTIGYNTSSGPVGTAILIDDEYTGGWESHFGSLGANGPGQARWGDYLDARPDDDFPKTWIASGFSSSAANTPRTTPNFFWFGREEDSPTKVLPLSLTTAEGFAYAYNPITGDRVNNTLSFDAFLDFNGDIDSYYYSPQSTGLHTISASAGPGSGVDTYLAVYDAASGQLIGTNDDFGGLSSQMQVSLNTWQRYIIAVADYGNNSTGDVVINVFGPTATFTSSVSLDSFGDASVQGTIDSNGDVDFYSVVAPLSTTGLLSLALTPNGALNPQMVLWGPGGVELARGSTSISYASATAGTEYRVSVFSSFYSSAGNFSLSFSFTDSAYFVTNTNDSGSGSLRQALLDSNAHPNGAVLDRIRFAIPSTGTQTINLATELPAITNPVQILGATQPGFFNEPLIRLNGLALQGPGATADGLKIPAGGAGSLISWLDIRNFPSDGVEITSANNSVTANVIGQNLNGISLATASATGNYIASNWIGTDRFGVPLPQLGRGVQIANASSNTVSGNVVANNSTGVRVSGGINDLISQNSIYANSSLGIDLQPASGYTANDVGDIDEGGNRLQNSPVMVGTPVKVTDNLKVTFRIDSNPLNVTYPLTVEFYVSDGARQGRTYLGSTVYGIAAYNAGDRTVTLIGAAAGLTPGVDKIVTLARDANGNTSEFSQDRSLRGSAILPEAAAAVVVQQNGNQLDVNDDQNVSALDALLVINALRRSSTGEGELDESMFLDTNGDGTLSPLDALLVINALKNRQAAPPIELKEVEVWDDVLVDLTADLKLKRQI